MTTSRDRDFPHGTSLSHDPRRFRLEWARRPTSRTVVPRSTRRTLYRAWVVETDFSITALVPGRCRSRQPSAPYLKVTSLEVLGTPGGTRSRPDPCGTHGCPIHRRACRGGPVPHLLAPRAPPLRLVYPAPLARPPGPPRTDRGNVSQKGGALRPCPDLRLLGTSPNRLSFCLRQS